MQNLSNNQVIHIVKENTQYLQFRKLLEYEDIITHAYSLGIDVNYRTANAEGPVKQMDVPINAYKNICSAIGSNYTRVIKSRQAHTNNVKIVTNKINKDKPDFNLEEYKSIDGLITNKKNLMLSTTNADCILLLLFDPVKKVVANVHSGWKGTLHRIVVNAINQMITNFGCDPKDIICCICPSIRKCHFEVEKEVKEQFEKEFEDLIGISFVEENQKKQIKLEDIIEEKVHNEKWNIDTILINKIILQSLGLKSENIIDSGICSACNSNLIHSYRIEKENYGLETALIELK